MRRAGISIASCCGRRKVPDHGSDHRNVIRLKDSTQAVNATTKVARKVEESAYRISKLVINDLSQRNLEAVATERRKLLTSALGNPTEWKTVFCGRDILTTSTKRYGKGQSYQAMRDMIVSSMSERGHRPSGKLRILAPIDNAWESSSLGAQSKARRTNHRPRKLAGSLRAQRFTHQGHRHCQGVLLKYCRADSCSSHEV